MLKKHHFLKNFFRADFESLDLDLELTLKPSKPLNKKLLEFKNISNYIENRRQFQANSVASFFSLKDFKINAFLRFLHIDEAIFLLSNFSNFFDKEKLTRTLCVTASKDGYTKEPKFFYAITSLENLSFISKLTAKQKSKIAEVLGTLSFQDLEISEDFFANSQEFQIFCNQVLKFKNAEDYFQFLRGAK